MGKVVGGMAEGSGKPARGRGRGGRRAAAGAGSAGGGVVPLFTEMQMKVFLDRYAFKGAELKAGGSALVMAKQDPRRGQVVAVLGEEDGQFRARLASGEEATFGTGALVPLLEKSPLEMWDRVARAIAGVEKADDQRQHWAGRFRWALDGFKFVPGGRILAGAGTGKDLTYYNCLPPDQEVLTPDGYRPICELRVGDMVISGKKRARRVTHVFSRHTREPLYLIQPRKLGFDPLRLTGEHPVLAIRQESVNRHRSRDGLRLKEPPQWMKARDLRVGDFVAVGWDAETSAASALRVIDHLPVGEFQVADGWVTKAKLHKPIKNEVSVDEDFMLLAGTWLGDGCITHRTGTEIPTGIQITFHEAQKPWAEQVATIVEDKFGVRPAIRPASDGQRLYQVHAESRVLGLFFKNLYGCYHDGKRIPSFLTRLDTRLILPLIKGLFRSDGYLAPRTMGIALSNKTLAVQLHQLLLRTGRFFSIFENTHPLGKTPAYRVSAGVSEANGLCEYVFGQQRKNERHDQKYYLEYDGLKWVRIESITTQLYEGMVHDIEVEDDHSFISAGVVVSNCYVIPSPHDSRKGIVTTLEQMIEIMARGGGVGINGSSLRPQGAYVRGVNGTSSGAVSWMEIYSDATGLIEQGGSRRGALMLMLAAWHPDVESFITVKRDHHRFNNANLSVIVPDSFMEAVEKDADWDLLFPDTDHQGYKEIWDGDINAWRERGLPIRVYKTVRARELWDQICESNWLSAEPGVVFMERYNKESNTWYFQKLISVNPCGEQGLPGWGVCNLGAIGLSSFVKDRKVDWDGLAETVRVAVRFLDDVIDDTLYVFEENRRSQMEARRVGLGTQGLAHMLIKLGLRYGSPEANTFIDELYRRIMIDAYWASVEIAKEKGPFGAFDREKFIQGAFIKRLPADLQAAIAQHGIRNATLLTQAPTGTTSLLAGMSSGIEPVFRFKMKRVDRIGEHVIYDPLYEAWEKANPGRERPAHFVEADDLTPEEHVTVQAIIQKYVDSSISKTANAPNDHRKEDTRRVYELAYRLGCKGITYFRDGSRTPVLSEVKEEDKGGAAQAGAGDGAPTGTAVAGAGADPRQLAILPEAAGPRALAEGSSHVNGAWGDIHPIDRPLRLQGFTDVKETPLGKLFLTLNVLDGHPIEVFAQIGKAGTDVAAFTEGVARLASLALRCGVAPAEVAEQLIGIGGSRSVGFGPNRVRSVPDAIGQFIMEYVHRLAERAEQEAPAGGPADGPAGGAAGPGASYGDPSPAGGKQGDLPPAEGGGAGPNSAAGEAAAGGTVAGMPVAGSGRVLAGTALASASALASATVELAGHSLHDNGHRMSVGQTALCPNCGMHSLVPTEGCATCMACGFSEC